MEYISTNRFDWWCTKYTFVQLWQFYVVYTVHLTCKCQYTWLLHITDYSADYLHHIFSTVYLSTPFHSLCWFLQCTTLPHTSIRTFIYWFYLMISNYDAIKRELKKFYKSGNSWSVFFSLLSLPLQIFRKPLKCNATLVEWTVFKYTFTSVLHN